MKSMVSGMVVVDMMTVREKKSINIERKSMKNIDLWRRHRRQTCMTEGGFSMAAAGDHQLLKAAKMADRHMKAAA